MAMDFMAHRVLLLINLITILFVSCSAEKPPKTEFNVAGLEIKNKNGVLFCDNKPFSGRLYALNNTDTSFIRDYSNGLEDGIHKLWYPNKQIAEIRYYREGKKSGLHFGFWDNGQKKYSYSFENDLYEDKQYEWYPNGQAFSRRTYKKGHESGIQQTWTQEGKLRSNYEARNGRNYGNIGKKNCQSKI